MTNFLRQKVSLKKKRFQDNDFDLDLAYITERIIAFGFPAEGREAVFRNPMEECQRFFDKFHEGSYWIYNLCIEKNRQYKPQKFHNRVSKYQWPDHNAPFLEMLPDFCQHATDWLNKSENNVVGIHCKAGKGRTGVLICCLLLYQKMFDDPDEAMDFYGKQRTFNGHGVTIPSQRRFIRYFHQTLVSGIPPPKHETALIKRIVIEKIGSFEDTHFGLLIESNGTAVKTKRKGDKGLIYLRGEDSVTLDLGTLPVSGNTKITIFKPGKKKDELFHFWFHCHFVRDVVRFEKSELDKAISDKEHKIFPADFAVEVYFERLDLYDAPQISQSAPNLGSSQEPDIHGPISDSSESNDSEEESD